MGKLTTTTVSGKYLTTIPKPVRNYLDVDEGDTVEWHVVDGDVVVEVAEE